MQLFLWKFYLLQSIGDFGGKGRTGSKFASIPAD
jgi:hypothetical protein